VIDEINIYQATKVAMQMAVAYLPYKPDHLLIDAVRLTELDLPQKPIIHGDALSLSIAAASIVAKVYRDRIMMGLHFQFPEYSFFTNKGYGTMAHFRAINAHGLLPLHRRSFIPMKYLVRHDTEALSTYRKMLLLKQEAEEEADAALA
jgi:ribonuclease HII